MAQAGGWIQPDKLDDQCLKTSKTGSIARWFHFFVLSLYQCLHQAFCPHLCSFQIGDLPKSPWSVKPELVGNSCSIKTLEMLHIYFPGYPTEIRSIFVSKCGGPSKLYPQSVGDLLLSVVILPQKSFHHVKIMVWLPFQYLHAYIRVDQNLRRVGPQILEYV